MSVKILFDGKELGTIEADLHQITRENDQKKNAGVLLDYDGETTFDFTFSTDEFEKSMHNLKMSKEIKIWRGDKILCAFDKKDVVDIVKSSSGVSRIEVADGSWFEVYKTVEYMKKILGVEEMK
ncbi:hypothetical protein ACFYP2_17105 [Bacillus velezensis]